MKLTEEQKRDLAADMERGRLAAIAAQNAVNEHDKKRSDEINSSSMTDQTVSHGPMRFIEPVTEQTYEDRLADAFPDVEPGARPLGARILVQLKKAESKTTKSGIVLVKETTDAEKFNNMVGKVVAIGPLAFRKRDSMEQWPEGAWCAVGDYIRVPKWGGDRWEVPYGSSDDRAIFVVMNDHEVIAAVTGDPLAMKAVY